jgi:hypothetical protein
MTAEPCRILAILGSGETSPTMVTVHKDLVARLGLSQPQAVLLDTPYAFQENAADVSARARSYFAASVGLDVDVLTSDVLAGDVPAGLTRMRSADWVFSGPGSPSYALTRWRHAPVGDALRERVASGTGITVLASAAAATAGLAAVPVYEIYKAGAEPHWLEGLDLLGALGLPAVLIPHYDNAEGGTHDTRYCYLGERRLAAMEPELPPGTAVLGVDEHTALILDLAAGTAEVRGRGSLTIRRGGLSSTVPAPATVTIEQLREMLRTGARAAVAPAAAAVPQQRPTANSPLPLAEVTRRCEQRFAQASSDRDGQGMVTAVLELEDAIHAWAADTEEDQGTNQARAVLRGLIGRLGETLSAGLRDPEATLGPAVGPLLELRSSLRADGKYAEADAIRAALTAAGLQVGDAADGTRWTAGHRR